MGVTRRVFTALIGSIGAADLARAQAPPAPTPWRVPSNAEIRNILADRIDVQKSGVGIVVGVVDANGRRVIAYGSPEKDRPGKLDADTVFEIGSITKVFTSLLLADMVVKGEVSLDDPVARYLPGVKVPERGGRQITLKDLATHTSGLPRMPSNFQPADPRNPYADYTNQNLYDFLASYSLTRDIGSDYAYSNMGAALLGQALCRRAGLDYETLVRRRITGPLGMTDTAIRLTPSMAARLAKPYDAYLDPAANWDLPTFAGAGALRSTADDMMTFLAAELELKPSPLRKAMDYQLSAVRRPVGAYAIALAWHFFKTPGGEVAWHNGGTGGYRTFIGFDPVRKVGVTVLTNAATERGGDDIGFHLLGGAPLASAPKPRVFPPVVSLTPSQLDALVGRYQLAPQVFVTITRDGGRLYAQVSTQGKGQVFPSGPTEVFWKSVEARASFELGADGRAAKITIHQGGRDISGARVAP